MRVLLHTPLKPPHDPTPSGDREMARGLQRLLRKLGHHVLMPELSRMAAGVPPPDTHLAWERWARRRAAELVRRWRGLPRGHRDRFDLWFTYHCYYRKPDWLGPLVTQSLGIPYVIAEVSHASRRTQGSTRLGHRAVERALAAADLVLTVSPRDVAGVKCRLRPGARQVLLPAFIDTAQFAAAGTTNDPPVLLTVAMMRTRDKLESYRVLADALGRLRDRPWRAVLVGDGPARPEIERAMASLGERVRFAGMVAHDKLPLIYASADLYAWPAINEAYGITFLEAQAAGLPVVAGYSGGVAAVVADGVTGILTPIGDACAFAEAIGRLLDVPAERARLAAAARARVHARHDEKVAAHVLASALSGLR